MYDPAALSAEFDEYGQREWNRLVATPVDEVSLHVHTEILRRYVRPGERVLEIGAGAGRFTQVLSGLGARIFVADLSPGQLALNRQLAGQLGFAASVEDWQVVDITDLSRFPGETFDAVVAYGGPFSYVLDRRDAALRECLRVLRPGGALLGSVMSLWGAAHRHLVGTLELPPEHNQRVTATGDLTPATLPSRTTNWMHLFRAGELRDWLLAGGLEGLALSASGVLANGYGEDLSPVRQDPARWAELLRMECEASADPACLGVGTHLIFAGRKPAGAQPEQIAQGIYPVTQGDLPRILEIWEASVRATHDFASEADIQFFKPLVWAEIQQVEHLASTRGADGQVTGFIFVAGDKIEMLFIDPAWRGKGLGRKLVEHALRAGATLVDVNEQNAQAVGFYERMGFVVESRSALDSTGKPYAILHMRINR